MSLEFNADKQIIQSTNPKIVGEQELSLRAGSGSDEKEVFRAFLDSNTKLPRIGVNRTNSRVEKLTVLNPGSGYTSAPTVSITGGGGSGAVATAVTTAGSVVGFVIVNSGSGYTSAPDVSINGGGGSGATAQAFLDTVEYEFDVNGAIRTSTSIISDTARILNLDIANIVTPDADFRAPYLKLYSNGTGTEWVSNTVLQKGAIRYLSGNIYKALNTGTTGSTAPLHNDGTILNGSVSLQHVGYRVDNPNLPLYGETGDGLYGRAVTPPLGDRSDKIATTEYVLNLATNDVGGRVYVSQQIGSDLNDGRSAAAPVRTIKRACQIATESVNVKETVIISGGDYVEDNPISIPPDCSVIGDNLRLVIVRPNNPRKHMFKFADKNYISGIVFRDKVDEFGDPQSTWDYACAFDDKQRIYYDPTTGGDFERSFPVGHQIFGEDRIGVTFQTNTGLSNLAISEYMVGVNTGAVGTVLSVDFDTTTGASAYQSGTVTVKVLSGAFQTGETFRYPGNRADPWTANTVVTVGTYLYDGNNVYQVTTAGTTGSTGPIHTSGAAPSGTATLTFIRNVYTFVAIDVKSVRAEGEVISHTKDLVSSLPIVRLDGSLQGTFTGGFGGNDDVGGIVVYTNALTGRSNIHNFKEGQEIEISGMPTSSPDLSMLNGKHKIYKVIEDADGRSRRFVIPKKIPSFTQSNYIPSSGAIVKSYSYYVTLSLLNSPNKFDRSPFVARRYQDASNLIKNNINFIKDEVYLQIQDEFSPNFTVSSIQVTDIPGSPSTQTTLRITTSGNHGFYANDNITLYKNNLNSLLNQSYNVSAKISNTVFEVIYSGTASSLGLVSGTTYNTSSTPALGSSAYVQRSFIIPNETKCRRDIGHFVSALIRDLEFGGNYHTIEAAKYYVSNAQIGYVGNEIVETVRAIEIARKLCTYAMCNWRTINGLTTDPLYTPKYSSVSRYFDSTVITATAGNPACNDVRNSINTLAYLFTDVLTNASSGASGTTGTQLDAAYLIARNADFIASEASEYAYAQYPALAATLTEDDKRKCKRDIRTILASLRRDLVLGGNAGIVTSAEAYFSGASLTGIPTAELAATRAAFTRAKELTIEAIRNWSSGSATTHTPTSATYNSTTGVVTVTIPTPASIPTAGSTRIAFKDRALTFSCNSNGGGNLASPTDYDRNSGRSLTITNVSVAGGSTTITCNVGPAGTAAGATHTFVSALANATILIPSPSNNPTYETSITRFEDWNILLDSSSPFCAGVATAITTEMTLLDNILNGSILPGATTKTYGTLYNPTITYPDGVIYDANNKYITPIAVWDDLPIIEASPYIQNASVISFLGGGGCEIDGSKVKQPNCPFPGLEPDGSATFPNQGKSMVAAQFTIISFGGTGYKIVNDGYTQLVSVFVLFAQDGVYADSGGYASITNSATNFGTYALRARGYSPFAYSFDVGTITNVSANPSGRTQFTITGVGREPLEHYIVKIDGYKNNDESIEYFVETVGQVSVGPPFTATITLNATASFKDSTTNLVVANSNSEFVGKTIRLLRPSIINSSSHTWEYAGAGNDYNALPENGGVKVEAYEQVSENYGRVYTSGTDELGDFKVGYFAKIENRTGAITFTGTVTISEVEFLKLKGGDVVVTGFDNSTTLGGAFSTDAKLPTQKAVKDYITNNLGPYINKPYSTNAVPRALVELTDSGKISIDQIPALRPFSVYTVANEAARLELEGALAGDIAIQTDTNVSYILNNDLTSLFVAFNVDADLTFTNGSIFTGSVSGGAIQSTEYRKGVLYKINITNPGSGYTSAPTVTISGGNPEAGAVSAAAVATIANGQVVTVTIIANNGYIGGKGYTTAPTIDFSAPGSGGTQATAAGLLESRLYGNIVNNIKIEDTDNISDNSTPAETVNITRVVNTSSSLSSNWVSLSSSTVAAENITSGVISTSRLAQNSTEANSFTFLRGDQTYVPTIQTLKVAENRYFAKTNAATSIGSSTLRFPTNVNILKGHAVVSISGIPSSTTVTDVLTSGGNTTVTLSNAVTNPGISDGTVIEFTRPSSAIVLSSNYTINSFVESIIIASGGTGFTNGVYTNVSLQGGAGTGLTANITISGGEVSNIIITNGGVNYTADFTVTGFNPILPGSGTGLVLLAKINTTPKNYSNTDIDLRRTDALTVSANPYGNTGIARFKKTQFNIGVDGDGSVELKTGADSGLDADLLDGAQGNFYLNGVNFVDGSIGPSKLGSGTYQISISGQSGSALRLITTTSSPSSNPNPNAYNEGITAETRNNSADGLEDGGTRHGILTFRQFGIGSDASGGGVRQLAFTDNDNMYIRGSGSGVSSFNSWQKIWTSINDGAGSGLDADRLDGRQGIFYQNSLNINDGVIFDRHIPTYTAAKNIKDSVNIVQNIGTQYYSVYIPGSLLTTSPFLIGQQVNLYDINSQGVGVFSISNIELYDDIVDSTLDYTVIYGALISGSFDNALTIGSALSNVQFRDYSISNTNNSTTSIAELYSSSGGTATLRLGRKDSTGSIPQILFNSSASPASNYNARITASGGNATDGSGSINIDVLNVDSVTIKNNKIWNEGNLSLATGVSGTSYDTTANGKAVTRDSSGNVGFNTVYASLSGAASLNVLKSGDTMSGDLTVGSTSRASNSFVRVLSSDANNAGFEAYGNSDGTGYLYVGQSSTFGGGISYNGDNSPSFASGETADRISFYRKNNGTNNVVFDYAFDSNTVNFKGQISSGVAQGTAPLVITSTTKVTNLNADLLDGNDSTAFLFTTGGTLTNNLRITKTDTTSSGTGSTTALWVDTPPNTISMFIGDAASTSGYGVDSYSGDIRFNGSNVAWGDLAYYPTGGDAAENGHFRFSVNGSTISSTPNAKIGVGNLFVAGGGLIGIGTNDPQKGIDYRQGGAAVTGLTAQQPGGPGNQGIRLVASEPAVFFHTDVNTAGTRSGAQTASASVGFGYFSAAAPTEFVIGTVTNHNIRFYTNNTLRFIMSNGGNFYPNSDNTNALGLSGNRWSDLRSTTATHTTCTSTDFNTTSDLRLKTNINVIGDALGIIEKLDGIRFDWKESGKAAVGIIAQQVQEVLPELITETEDEILTVNYNGLVGVLIQSIKELRAEIDTLKNK
jgi:hypothetical protein